MKIRARRVAALISLAAMIVVLAGSAAQADKVVVIRGRGWGHGIGMSQFGALGRARNGSSARSILTHYYSGAHVRRADVPRRVRIGLMASRHKVQVTSVARPDSSSSGRLEFKVVGASRPLAAGGAGIFWRIEPTASGKMRLYRNGDRIRRHGRTSFGGPGRPIQISHPDWGTLVRLRQKERNYAYGRVAVATHSVACGEPYCLRAVLTLPLQKYLLGLGEVPASWPRAALKAQTIAARTYAVERIERLGQHRAVCNCALVDSPADQVYLGDLRRTGAGSYWRQWRRAVDATKAMLVKYGGRPIQAYYSSSSGGHTENIENVWGGDPIPYLRGVRDRADGVPDNPNYRWRVKMSWRSFSRKLDRAFGVGRVRKVRLVRPFGVSGRVTVVKASGGGVRIVGSQVTRRVDGWDVRNALGLKDSWFRIRVHRTAATQVDVCERAAWRGALPVKGESTAAECSEPSPSPHGVEGLDEP